MDVRELRVRDDQLTVSWKNALKGLASGEASSVMTALGGYEALVYIGTIPAKVLDPTQAYPVVERELLDDKLHQAFDQWLGDALASATISVSPLLPMAIQDMERAAAKDAQFHEEMPVEEPGVGADNATSAQ